MTEREKYCPAQLYIGNLAAGVNNNVNSLWIRAAALQQPHDEKSG